MKNVMIWTQLTMMDAVHCEPLKTDMIVLENQAHDLLHVETDSKQDLKSEMTVIPMDHQDA